MFPPLIKSRPKAEIRSDFDFIRIFPQSFWVTDKELSSFSSECRSISKLTFPLNSLSRIDVYDSCLKFTLINSVVYDVKVNMDFFYFFEWEREKYD